MWGKIGNFQSHLMWWICFIIVTIPPTSSKEYRSDYVYNRKTDAFYKFHMEPLMHLHAWNVCVFEGAKLMVPVSEEDISQAHGMFKQFPDIGDVAWIGYDSTHHNTAEVVAETLLPENYLRVCDVLKRNGEVNRFSCYGTLPFICKIDAKDAPEDARCNVFGTDYKYFEEVGSCYKIPNIAYSWNGAYSECHAEGAHLIVLNSELEHDVIRNFTNKERSVINAHRVYFFFAGIRADKNTDGSPIVFRTIFNQTLEEAGFSQWTTNEPNNAGGNEYCGSIFKGDGKYNDVSCSNSFGFICEKEVKNT